MFSAGAMHVFFCLKDAEMRTVFCLLATGWTTGPLDAILPVPSFLLPAFCFFGSKSNSLLGCSWCSVLLMKFFLCSADDATPKLADCGLASVLACIAFRISEASSLGPNTDANNFDCRPEQLGWSLFVVLHLSIKFETLILACRFTWRAIKNQVTTGKTLIKEAWAKVAA